MAKMNYDNFIEDGIEEVTINKEKASKLEPISIDDAQKQLDTLSKRADTLREKLARGFNEETMRELNKVNDEMLQVSTRLIDSHNTRVSERKAAYEKEAARRDEEYKRKIAELERERDRKISAINKEEEERMRKSHKRVEQARREYQRRWN